MSMVAEKTETYGPYRDGENTTFGGDCPRDWVVKTLGELGTPVRGGSPRPAGDPRFFDGNFIPWLTVASLTNISQSTLVVTRTNSFLTEEGAERSRTLLPGTLIIANSGATLGVAKILDLKCCANDGIAALLDLDKHVSARYLAYYINSRTEYLREVVATGNGQPNLNTELIGNIRVPLPPTLVEQEAIAAALGDADALIESLEQLLAKKRLIKQGAMQELLTGRRRLPGFEKSDSSSATLGSVGTWRGGVTPSMSNTSYWQGGSFPWLSSGDIKSGIVTDSSQHITERAIREGHASVVTKHSVVVVNRSGILRRYLPVALISRDMAINQDLKALTTNANVIPEFIQQSIAFNGPEILASCLKSGTTVESLELRWLKAFPIWLPLPDEQRQIARFFGAIDTQISALTQRITSARLMKQAMMQQLLTGRIRLI